MHNNELGGFTLANSGEVHASIRLANTAGYGPLADKIRSCSSWEDALTVEDGHPVARQTRVAELEPETTGNIVELYMRALTGEIDAAHPKDVEFIKESFAGALGKTSLRGFKHTGGRVNWLAAGGGVDTIRQALNTYGLRGTAMQRLQEQTVELSADGTKAFWFDETFALNNVFYVLRLAAKGHRPAYRTPPLNPEVGAQAREMLQTYGLLRANRRLIPKLVSVLPIKRSNEEGSAVKLTT